MSRPVLGSVNILKTRGFGNRNYSQWNSRQGFGNFPDAACEGALQVPKNVPAVDGTQRLGTSARTGGGKNIGTGSHGFFAKPRQERSIECRHIASDDQV